MKPPTTTSPDSFPSPPDDTKTTTTSVTVAQATDTDALNLTHMGYTPLLTRHHTPLSVLATAFTLTNSWFAISVALVAGINNGGPVLVVYGLIIVGVVSLGVGVSLSELASGMPNAGGQYFWVGELAGRGWERPVSYLTGWVSWAGSVFTSASVSLACASAIVGCYQLSHPDFTISPWNVVLTYELTNLFAFAFNTSSRHLPLIARLSLLTSLLSFLIILIAVPAGSANLTPSPHYQPASFVFATFTNATGWRSNGVAFILGLINPNYAFACLDTATHLAEEVPRPERAIPLAIMGTIAIGFLTAWPFSLALFFCIRDLDAITSTDTLVPILELFHQAFGSDHRAGAIVLECLVVATGITCLIACHTWQSRLCWSFARDGGIPFPGIFSRVTGPRPGTEVPLAAHALSSVLVGVLGLIVLGSTTAFNSMVTACVVLLYVSYSIPVVCLWVKGRREFRHGPFWMGSGVLGYLGNAVLLAWTAVTLVMYSFPSFYPAEAGTMNYVSAVYGILALIVTVDWFVRARHDYRGQDTRHQDAEAKLREGGDVTAAPSALVVEPTKIG